MGLDLQTLTWIHTGISIVALITGFIVIKALFASKTPLFWTAVYLLTAVATSATGFAFPSTTFGPSHWVGVFSLAALVPAILALYVFRLNGAWRWIYTTTAVVVLYFLVFVLVAQAFMKVPLLHAAAPTLSEPPFAAAQIVALLLFLAIGNATIRKFHPEYMASA